MSNNKLSARVTFKHDTAANWSKAENFVPYNRELIIYDPDEEHPYERFKLGDGIFNPDTQKVEGTNIINLPFLNFGSDGDDIVVDQTYGAQSTNAQSGIAVTEAVDAKTIYTNTEPMISDVGGIKASEHTNGFDNVQITDLITELLYPYTKPVIDSFTLSPAAGVKKKGVSVTLASASVKITKKSKAISKIDLYRGSTLLKSITDKTIESTGTTVTFSGLNDTLDGNTNTTYTVKVSEQNGTVDVVNKTATYTFVNPYYQGVINKDDTINEALISGLNEKVETKGNKTYTYTTTASQCAVIAYPASYGVLKEIKDANNFTQTWSRYDISINNVSYYVYVSGAAAADNFKYTFTY